MSTRQINFDFFHIHSGKVKNLDNVLSQEEQNVKVKTLNTIKVFDYFARIRDIAKHDKCWIADVEKLNVQDEAYIGDLAGDRQTLAQAEDQGPIFDTIFLFDTLSEVLILQRNRSGLGVSSIRAYLAQLLGDDDLDLEIVLDPSAYHKFEKMSLVKEVEYTIAKPNMKFFKDEKRSTSGDLTLMKKLRAQNMYVKMGAPKNEPLLLQEAKKQVMSVLRHQDGDFESSTLKIKGVVNGEMDTIDLIKKRLIFPKKFQLTKGKKVTPPLLMDAALEAYKHHEDVLKGMFVKKLQE